MTRSEWLLIAAVIRDLWPHQPWPDSTLETGFIALSPHDAAQVRAAVMTLAMDGREFPPAVGLIHRRVVELQRPQQDWGDVWAEIHRAIRLHGVYADPDSLEWSSAEVDELIKLVGWQEICTYDLRQAGTFEAQCREKFKSILARSAEAAIYAQIPSAGLARLEGGNPRLAHFARLLEGKV